MARVKCKSDIPAGSPLALLFKNATAYLLRCGAVESRVFIATGRLRKKRRSSVCIMSGGKNACVRFTRQRRRACLCVVWRRDCQWTETVRVRMWRQLRPCRLSAWQTSAAVTVCAKRGDFSVGGFRGYNCVHTPCDVRVRSTRRCPPRGSPKRSSIRHGFLRLRVRQRSNGVCREQRGSNAMALQMRPEMRLQPPPV